MHYIATIINCDTTRSRQLFTTTDKNSVTNKVINYFKRIGLDDDSLLSVEKNNKHCTLFTHPTAGLCVLRLEKI